MRIGKLSASHGRSGDGQAGVCQPAGTVTVCAYEVITTDAITVNGQTTSSSAQAWFAPGIGLIKTVTGSGANAVSEVLTSYKVK